MAFRQPKSDRHQRDAAWQVWIEAHRATLQRIGLPPEVFLTKERWLDFVENGHEHWHESTGFEFSLLSADQQAVLLRFLDSQASLRKSMLASWLRVRTRGTQD
ncbi:MAG: hypothetical protein U0836_06240 [Pirellulales bacterium]